MKKIIPIFVCWLFELAAARGQSGSCTASPCTAAGVDRYSVLAALPAPSASGTFVVNIPSGTSAWTTELSCTVPAGVTSLTIQGQTTVSCTGTGGTAGYSCTATDNTVIVDGYAIEQSIFESLDNETVHNIVRLSGILTKAVLSRMVLPTPNITEEFSSITHKIFGSTIATFNSNTYPAGISLHGGNP